MPLTVRSLGKAYGAGTDRVVALENVSFAVHAGEFLSLVGPSGCGKSTLLYMLAGLAEPSQGEILLFGRRVTGPGPERGLLFQTSALFPWMKIVENASFGLKMRGVPKLERARIAGRFLEMVGLKGFEHRYPHELSGGMKQRAEIARVLAYDPEILLMDEPFGALDAYTRFLMQTELLRIWEQTRKAIVFVTHSVEEAVYLSGRVLVMGCRPGTIKKELVIPLKRPRAPDVILSEEFLGIRDQIWVMLQKEFLT
ncbi:MAG: ABC transporter ATP-binding protein [Chloroflexi bacterium]|nr:ABC transporter ATP-binding protein [Chloroflexota bacterium]